MQPPALLLHQAVEHLQTSCKVVSKMFGKFSPEYANEIVKLVQVCVKTENSSFFGTHALIGKKYV